MKILFHFRAILELYIPLTQKLNYFNEEYLNRLKYMVEKIQKVIKDKIKYLEINEKEKMGFEEKLIKKFIEGNIDVEIIKVSVEESIQYIGVDMEYFEKVESEGKIYGRKSFTNKVNI